MGNIEVLRCAAIHQGPMEVSSWTHESWIHFFLVNSSLWSTSIKCRRCDTTPLKNVSFDRGECRGTGVRDQTEIAWYRPQYSMGNNFPNMSVTELRISSSAILPQVSESVFWGVSSTDKVLFLFSYTRRNFRLLCVGVPFVISSSRYRTNESSW